MAFQSSVARKALCAALGLLVAMALVTPSDARRRGNRGPPRHHIPCEIKDANGTQLYTHDCIFENEGLFSCQDEPTIRRPSRGPRRGPHGRGDSSEEDEDLTVSFCLPTTCTPGGNECPIGVACSRFGQCVVTREERVIARACNLTTADGQPITSLGSSSFMARLCMPHEECGDDSREITYNSVTMFASSCRRARRHGHNSSSSEEDEEEQNTTTTTAAPVQAFEP